MCAKFVTAKRGGRPSKKVTKRGRPKGISINRLIDHIKEIAIHAPSPSLLLMELDGNTGSEVACKHCNKMLQNPLELACGHHACADCVKKHLLSSKTLICPQCTTEHAIELSSIRSPSKLLLQLLGRVQVRCTQCKRLVFAEAAEQHVHSNCSQHTITSLDAMTEQPVTTPLNEAEKKVGDYIVRRMIAGTTQPVPISTGGQVS